MRHEQNLAVQDPKGGKKIGRRISITSALGGTSILSLFGPDGLKEYQEAKAAGKILTTRARRTSYAVVRGSGGSGGGGRTITVTTPAKSTGRAVQVDRVVNLDRGEPEGTVIRGSSESRRFPEQEKLSDPTICPVIIDFGVAAYTRFQTFTSLSAVSVNTVQVQETEIEVLISESSFTGPYAVGPQPTGTLFNPTSEDPFKNNELTDSTSAIVENGNPLLTTPTINNVSTILEQRAASAAEIIELGALAFRRRTPVAVGEVLYYGGYNNIGSNYIRLRIQYYELETFDGVSTGTYQQYRQDIILYFPEFENAVVSFNYTAFNPTYESATGARSGELRIDDWATLADNGIQDGTILTNVVDALTPNGSGITAVQWSSSPSATDNSQIDSLVGMGQPGIIRKAKTLVGSPIAF